MQPRSLFAVLIIGFAVGIAFAEDHDDALLEEKSLEELSGAMIEASRAYMHGADAEAVRNEKLGLLKLLPNHPELKRYLNLPVDQFCDLVHEKLTEEISKMSPSEKAEEKELLIGVIKTLDALIDAALEQTE